MILGANLLLILYGVDNVQAAARTAGQVAVVNMSVFYLGPHLSYQADLLNVSLPTMKQIHGGASVSLIIRCLGQYSSDCRRFLLQSVQQSVWLWIQLLHPHIKYQFDYQDGVNCYTAKGLPVLWSRHWPVLLPGVKRGTTTISEPLVAFSRSDCEACDKDVNQSVVEIA